jgi:hypothetical protein
MFIQNKRRKEKMKRTLISLLVVLVFAGTSFAQSLIRPKTADDNLGTATYPFGTVYASGIAVTTKTYKVDADTVHVPSNLVVTGTIVGSNTLDITGTLTGSGLITSYGYNVDVSSNKSALVYMTQSGTLTPASGGAATTLTNTFAISFIEAPAVFITQYNITQTNLAIAVLSNQFTVTGGDGWQTNAGWMARGRIK